MNIRHTLPAAALALLFSGSALFASATEPSANIPRITIVAKRMTAVEKARFDQIERRAEAAKARHPKAIVVARKAS